MNKNCPCCHKEEKWCRCDFQSVVQEFQAMIQYVLDHYPEDVFVPPTSEWLQELNAFCESKGHTLDAISGEMARRICRILLADVKNKYPPQ